MSLSKAQLRGQRAAAAGLTRAASACALRFALPRAGYASPTPRGLPPGDSLHTPPHSADGLGCSAGMSATAPHVLRGVRRQLVASFTSDDDDHLGAFSPAKPVKPARSGSGGQRPAGDWAWSGSAGRPLSRGDGASAASSPGFGSGGTGRCSEYATPAGRAGGGGVSASTTPHRGGASTGSGSATWRPPRPPSSRSLGAAGATAAQHAHVKAAAAHTHGRTPTSILDLHGPHGASSSLSPGGASIASSCGVGSDGALYDIALGATPPAPQRSRARATTTASVGLGSGASAHGSATSLSSLSAIVLRPRRQCAMLGFTLGCGSSGQLEASFSSPPSAEGAHAARRRPHESGSGGVSSPLTASPAPPARWGARGRDAAAADAAADAAAAAARDGGASPATAARAAAVRAALHAAAPTPIKALALKPARSRLCSVFG
jgi:hypothetical protein